MSIIEKAMQKAAAQSGKLQTSKPVENNTDAPDAGGTIKPTQGDNQQQILEHLQAVGILPDNEQLQRNKDEYRRIKRPLLANAFSQGVTPVDKGNVILISSSLPMEGKTHNSINLAISIARELNHSVLLVDADVAKADVSRVFNAYDHVGLTDLLLDEQLDVNQVLMETGISGFSLLPAGHHHFDTTELLASERMRSLVNELANRDENQLVLIDSPPVLVASDPQVLASLAGQIVLVVEAVKTSRHIVTQAITSLNTDKPVNLVLNKSNRSLGFAYYGAYYYGYGKDTPE